MSIIFGIIALSGSVWFGALSDDGPLNSLASVLFFVIAMFLFGGGSFVALVGQ